MARTEILKNKTASAASSVEETSTNSVPLFRARLLHSEKGDSPEKGGVGKVPSMQKVSVEFLNNSVCRSGVTKL